MEVKGVAFLARQMMVVQEHGEPAWRTFISQFSEKDPRFAQTVMPVTRLPVDSFVRFNEALVQHFYGGDPRAWWQFGIKSAEYALSRGQLKTMFATGDLRRFLLFTPGIWKSYFTAGELLVRPEPEYTELRIAGVPRPHLYFELSVMGFASGGLQMLGASNPRHEVIKGFSRGHPEVIYRFYVS
ncbi:MAG: hypothetical protein ACJ8AT_15150 [Hyalangium sp.]|uniref:hypothetical protein n=1 Tax=Hyalangium sp. TaxID=2028555 RepID=UPI00389A6DA9